AAVQRKPIGLPAIVVAVLNRRLRWTAGNECRQAGVAVRFRRRDTRLLAGFLRLRVTRLIGAVVARHERLCIRRNVGLRLPRAESLVSRERLAVVVAVLEAVLVAR